MFGSIHSWSHLILDFCLWGNFWLLIQCPYSYFFLFRFSISSWWTNSSTHAHFNVYYCIMWLVCGSKAKKESLHMNWRNLQWEVGSFIICKVDILNYIFFIVSFRCEVWWVFFFFLKFVSEWPLHVIETIILSHSTVFE